MHRKSKREHPHANEAVLTGLMEAQVSLINGCCSDSFTSEGLIRVLTQFLIKKKRFIVSCT